MAAAGKMSKYLLTSLSPRKDFPPPAYTDLPTQYRTYPNHLAKFVLFSVPPPSPLPRNHTPAIVCCEFDLFIYCWLSFCIR